MKKRLISSIAIALACTFSFPTLVHATTTETQKEESIVKINWKKDYPKLVNPNKEEIKAVNYSAETMLELKNIMTKLDSLEKNYGKNKTDDYMKIFKQLFELHNKMTDEDRQLFDSNDQFSYIFYKANYLVFTEFYEQTETFNKFYQDLSDTVYYYAVEIYNKAPNRTFLHFLFEYVFNLTSEKDPKGDFYFKDEKTNAIIQIAYSRTKILGTGAGGRQNYPNNPDDDIEYDKPSDAYTPPSDKPEVPPDFTPDDVDNDLPTPPNVPEYNDDGTTEDPNNGVYIETEFVSRNGACYSIEITKDYYGNIINIKENRLSSENGFFCGIIDGLDFTNIPWNSDGAIFNGEKALDVWNSLAENELNATSNLTLQYSINKRDSNPYYYDSGIKVSIDRVVTYTQLRDVLNQIALKAGGYLIEDSDKILFICEGKPLVIKEKQSNYTEDDINNLLTSFDNLGLKIAEKKTESVSIDEELVNSDESQIITINGEKIELSAKPRLNNSILQLPVEDVAKALGYSVNITDKVATLTKGTTTIEIQIDSKSVKINDKEKLTATNSSMIDDTLFAEMNIVAQESGVKIYFDKTKGTIDIR